RLHSLPNGVKDEVSDEKLYKRTNKYVLQSEDVTSVGNLTDMQYVSTAIIADAKNTPGDANVIGEYFVEGMNKEISRDSASTEVVNSGFVIYNGSVGNLVFGFQLGTYTDLAAAQADLAGTSLIYQLAEEQVYDLPNLRNLYSYDGSTTLIIEPAIEFEAIANSDGQVTIPNNSLTINYIESVQEKIVDGESISYIDAAYTEVNETTLGGLTEGKKYKVVYHYPQELTTLPELTITYPVNMAASLSDIYEIQKKLEKELGSVWITLLPLADKELSMYSIPLLTTETTTDLKNKINDILQVWKG
ncbi:MAG: hypothetical protein MJA84_01845, partial [Firmicutes bacterium]|nr:hypothetical protein [Bacillota bacterium]